VTILAQGSSSIQPAPEPTMIGGALSAGQKLVIRNVGPVVFWLGDQQNATPHQGTPVLPGEPFVTDDPGGGGVWAVTERVLTADPIIPGLASWLITDAYDANPGALTALDALIGVWPIPAAAGTTTLVSNLPVGGWDALGLYAIPNTLGNDIKVTATWDLFNPATPGMANLAGAGLGNFERAQHLTDLRGIGWRDLWGHEGDYLTVKLTVGTQGQGGASGGSVALFNTRRTRPGGYPPAGRAYQAPIGYGDDGRLMVLTNVAAGNYALPPYAGRARVWAAGLGGGFITLGSRRIDEVGFDILDQSQASTAAGERFDLDLPPLINQVNLSGTSNYLILTATRTGGP